jgi:hypothetical protein
MADSTQNPENDASTESTEGAPPAPARRRRRAAGAPAGAPAVTPEPVGAPAPKAAETAVERDNDGVELGELPVTEAPDPRPAPRFDGKVLHRPERSGGRRLVWLVWVLIALALAALVALLLTGVLAPADAAALGATPDLILAHPVLEDLTA